MFDDYPDIVNAEQIARMIGISKSSVYALLKTNQIHHVRVGTKYIIPKQAIIAFISGMCYNGNQIISGRLQPIKKGEVM